MATVTPLDVHWMGRAHTIAAALFESAGRSAILDPGPASTLEELRAQLRAHGRSVVDLDTILLTHIHLDHSGATGALVRENPRLRVYVHRKGSPHLIDPSKLLASAGRLWGDDLPRLFGETLAVPAQNLHILEGGENLSFGDKRFEVVYTPGHASHHVSYFDSRENIAFVGDTAGIRVASGPYIMPATPPPDIDLAAWEQSFEAIRSRRPTRLFLTHFGFAENPAEHLAAFRERLHRWAGITEKVLQSGADEAGALRSFIAETQGEMSEHLSAAEIEQYSFTAGLPLSFLGLARHIRKRTGARE